MILSACMLSAGLSLAIPSAAQEQADWPGWRGPGGNGVSSAQLPVEWSEERNLRWKTEIPGLGHSSPVAIGGRIFVTSALATGEPGEAPERESDAGGRGRGRGAPPAEHDFLLVAVEHGTGEVLWERVVATGTPHEGKHGDSTFASPTLISDGERLFVSFGSMGFFAYDLEGELLWKQDLGEMTMRNSFGEGSSPTLAGDKLVILWQHEGDSYLAALNTKDGKQAWRTPRESGSSYCTPTSVETPAGSLIIVPGNTTSAYRASDGVLAWSHELAQPTQASGGGTEEASSDRPGRGNRGNRGGRGGRGGAPSSGGPSSSAVTHDGRIYLSSARRGGSMLALHTTPQEAEKAEGKGAQGQLIWALAGDTPYVPSPLYSDGLLYALKSNGPMLMVIDGANGEVVYEGQRLTDVGESYASPIAAGGRIYFSGRGGSFEVIQGGREFKSLAVNELDDRFDASPGVLGNTLLLRGHRFLYCIEELGDQDD